MNPNSVNTLAPVSVNLNACDGCSQCSSICPTEVFEMIELSSEEVKELSFLGRLKVRIKGNIKSHVANPEACIACGKCASSCHERAISILNTKRRA